MNLDTSSLATRSCSSTVGVSLPVLGVRLLQQDDQTRKWRDVGHIETNLSVDVYKAPKGWQEKAALQQAFIREEDALTQRIWYMYRDGVETSDGHHVNGVYLPRPRAVSPTTLEDEDDDESSETNGAESEHAIEGSSAGSSDVDEQPDKLR